MTENCLYVNFDDGYNFGGGKFNQTVLLLLQDVFVNVDICTFPMGMSRMRNLKNTLCGYLNGMDGTIVKSICEKASSRSYDWIFLASSNFGKLAKALKQECPATKICVLFNNIEYNFIHSQLTSGFRPQLLLTLGVTYYNEKNILKYADRVIVLNSRENRELNRIYGRKADTIIPIILRDEYTGEPNEYAQENDHKELLLGVFVGSNFYANKHAVEWFVKNVAPFTPTTMYEIVGRGFETERHLECDNVKIVGGVDDVSHYYAKSDFVIAPIFKGAGMKVKVAEAMMYGRTVLGTPEAFEGYDDVSKYGKVCAEAADFINVINNRDFVLGYNPDTRESFLRSYEYMSVKDKLIRLFSDEDK